MNYIVYLNDGRFVGSQHGDLVREYPDAYLFTATGAVEMAKRLNREPHTERSRAHAISTKAYAEGDLP
jgi:hypothetical protein